MFLLKIAVDKIYYHLLQSKHEINITLFLKGTSLGKLLSEQINILLSSNLLMSIIILILSNTLSGI